MKRSQLNPMPEYFDRYINMCDDVEITKAIEISIRELMNIPLDKWKQIGDEVYAPGKWTIKDILQHMLDTERIFTYRALAFSRRETQQVPSFDEDGYAKSANANERKLEDIVAEMHCVRQSTLFLYKSFNQQALLSMGSGFKGKYSVASIGFIIPGHQRWHMKVIEEKYLPLLLQKSV